MSTHRIFILTRFILTFIAYFRLYMCTENRSEAYATRMPIEITYRCWGCGEEQTEVEPSEDPTRSQIIIWNLCPSCITKKEDDKCPPTSQGYSKHE